MTRFRVHKQKKPKLFRSKNDVLPESTQNVLIANLYPRFFPYAPLALIIR